LECERQREFRACLYASPQHICGGLLAPAIVGIMNS
jgi:hypothetical protein